MSNPRQFRGRGRGRSLPRPIPANQDNSIHRPQPTLPLPTPQPLLPNPFHFRPNPFRPLSPPIPSSFSFFPDPTGGQVIPAAAGTIPGSSPRSSSPARRFYPSEFQLAQIRRNANRNANRGSRRGSQRGSQRGTQRSRGRGLVVSRGFNRVHPAPSPLPRPAPAVSLSAEQIQRIERAYTLWEAAGRAVDRATHRFYCRGTQLRDALSDAHALHVPVSDNSDWDDEDDWGIAWRRGEAPSPDRPLGVPPTRVTPGTGESGFRSRSTTPPCAAVVAAAAAVVASPPSPSSTTDSVEVLCDELGIEVVDTPRSPSPSPSTSTAPSAFTPVLPHSASSSSSPVRFGSIEFGTSPVEPLDLRCCLPPVLALDTNTTNSLPASPTTISNYVGERIIVTSRWRSAGPWCPHAARRRPVLFDSGLPATIRELAEHTHSAPVSSADSDVDVD